jgi:hypothetical protein
MTSKLYSLLIIIDSVPQKLCNFNFSYPRILTIMNSVEMKTKLHNTTLNYDLTHVGNILTCVTSDRCGHKHIFV